MADNGEVKNEDKKYLNITVTNQSGEDVQFKGTQNNCTILVLRKFPPTSSSRALYAWCSQADHEVQQDFRSVFS